MNYDYLLVWVYVFIILLMVLTMIIGKLRYDMINKTPKFILELVLAYDYEKRLNDTKY